MKPQIKFSRNWNNKLNQEYFTTIRRLTPIKAEYYLDNLHKVFDVILNGKKYCEARLLCVESIKLGDIPYGLRAVDTGSESPRKVFYKFGIGSETDVIVLTFRRLR